MNSPAQSLDDLPRPGVAISRERWLDLIAKEARLTELYRDTGADRADELADLSKLVAENAELRAELNRAIAQNQQDREATGQG